MKVHELMDLLDQCDPNLDVFCRYDNQPLLKGQQPESITLITIDDLVKDKEPYSRVVVNCVSKHDERSQ